MNKNNTITLNLPAMCTTISRTCVYLYSLVFFLRTIISFPSGLDGVLRIGIALFGFTAFFVSGRANLRRVHLSQFFIWYCGLLLISFLSSIYSVNANTQAITNNIWDILFLGIGFSVSVKDEESKKKFLFFFSICGGIVYIVLMSNNLLYVDDRLGRSLTGDNTNTFALFLMLTLPWDVIAMPWRAILVGRTQSNISTPRSTPSNRQSGLPTPMR